MPTLRRGARNLSAREVHQWRSGGCRRPNEGRLGSCDRRELAQRLKQPKQSREGSPHDQSRNEKHRSKRAKVFQAVHSWTTLLPKSTSPGRPSWPGPFCLVLEFLLLLVRLNQVIRMLSNTGGLSIHASPMGHTLGAAEPALSPSGYRGPEIQHARRISSSRVANWTDRHCL